MLFGGVGLESTDERINNPFEWKGENLLGFILTSVKEGVENNECDEDGNLLPPVDLALKIAFRYGTIDGDHHKTWVIDQMVRALTGENYKEWVKDHNYGEEGPDTYKWAIGIAP